MQYLLLSTREGKILKKVPLTGRRKVSIGRSPRNDLPMPVPSVSRRHALLFEHRGVWQLIDLGSRKGLRTPDPTPDSTPDTTPDPVRRAVLRADKDGNAWVRIGPGFLWLAEDQRPHDPRVNGDHGATAAPIGLEVDGGDLLGIDARDEPQPLTLIGTDPSGRGLFQRPLSPTSDDDLFTIGRSHSCDVPIDDDAVSRVHAVLHREGDRWYIADTWSRGGLYVDGERTLRKRLAPGITLRIGAVLIQVHGSALDLVLTDESDGANDVDVTQMDAPAIDPDATPGRDTAVRRPADWPAGVDL